MGSNDKTRFLTKEDALTSMTKEINISEEEAKIIIQQAYNPRIKEKAYVARGSVVTCNQGSCMSRIDLPVDHGITLEDGNPIVTINDAMAGVNLHDFGICKKQCDESGYCKCTLSVNGSWQSPSIDSTVPNLYVSSTGSYQKALPSDASLACNHSGLVSIAEVIQPKQSYETDLSKYTGNKYFVLAKRDPIPIRVEPNGAYYKSAGRNLKWAPGTGFDRVPGVPIKNVGGVDWMQVYCGGGDKGWIGADYTYPDKMYTTKFPTSVFSSVKAEFKKGEKVVATKTKDCIKDWGLCGKYPQKKGKDIPDIENGRYKVAVGPKILYPDYPDSGKLEDEDFTSFNREITVHVKDNKTLKTVKIPCIVVDIKAHTYTKFPDGTPKEDIHKDMKDRSGKVLTANVENGYIQTGMAYPKSKNAKKNSACHEKHFDGSIIEFACTTLTSLVPGDYTIEKITSNETLHKQHAYG